MQPLERFALQAHQGSPETDPADAQLIVDGHLSALRIPGRLLRRQYQAALGYVLITELDYWIEEAVFVVLLSLDLQQVLAHRMLARWYSSYYLQEVQWQDDRHFFVTIEGLEQQRFYFTLRARHWPLIRPRMDMSCRKLDSKSGKWTLDPW